MINLILNNKPISTDIDQGEVALDFIRKEQGLKGTKEGCREGDCGACSVLLGELTENGMRYRAVASCLLPVGELHGKHLVTIEGLNGETLSPVQQAIVDEGATQCGFCTPGIIISLTGFLLNSPTLSQEDAISAIEGNICRCTGYTAISRAVEKLTATLAPPYSIGQPPPKQRASAGANNINERIKTMVNAGILPDLFLGIAEKLSAIAPWHRGAPAPNTPSENTTPIVVGGGTDIYVQRANQMLSQPLNFTTRNPAPPTITTTDNRIIIDAATTTENLMNAEQFIEKFPSWKNSFRLISSKMIRNRATVAGNIANASPIGDISIMLLALNATLVIQSSKNSGNTREVALDKFYKGYKQLDLQKDEIITQITLPALNIKNPAPNIKFNFEKVSKRQHLDIASVNTAILIHEENGQIIKARISAGGVGPIPTFLENASTALIDKPLTRATITFAANIAANEVTPISDVRGSADYKTNLLRHLIIAHFTELFPDFDRSAS